MRTTVVFTLFFYATNSFGCDCKGFSKNDEYKISDAIFLGEVLRKENDRFEIRTLEFLKGNEFESTWVPISDCSVVPKVGEIWLFYSRTTEDEIFIDRCGYSRSYRHPTYINSFHNWTLPEPPPSGMTDQGIELLGNLSKDRALAELNFDIVMLRELKTQRMIMENRETQIENTHKLSLLLWGIGCFALVTFVALVMMRRRKHL